MKKSSTNPQATLFDSLENTLGSETENPNNSLIEIEKITPEAFKNKGEKLTINYNYKNITSSPYLTGRILIASTSKGICYMGFSDDDTVAFTELKNRFPNAKFIEKTDIFQENIFRIFHHERNEIERIELHLQATEFQFKVWKELLKIPSGKLSTYGELAKSIGQPKAARAVGTAIGSNPIAIVIPCHRVVQSSGALGGYRWGEKRKASIIKWEIGKK